jgi:hypothetical protein
MATAVLTHTRSVEAFVAPGAAAWRSLYRVAAVAAVLIVVTLPVALYSFIAWPPPTTIADWFTFLQTNRVAAVINLDLVLLLDQILFVPIILALYVTLRRDNPPLILLGTVGTLLGGVLLLVSREATFTLPMLSDRYAVATTDTERLVMLAAGQTLLSTFNGTAFSTGYALIGLAGLLVTGVMLRGHVFNRATAYCGIATYAFGIVPPTIGMIGVMLSLVSLVPLVPFEILLAWRFWQLAAQDAP